MVFLTKKRPILTALKQMILDEIKQSKGIKPPKINFFMIFCREAALRKVKRKENSQGPVFAVTFDPRLPALGQIQARHWRSMTNRDTYLKNVFQRPPLIAFKRQQNIRGHLIRAQVARAKRPYPQRKQQGMKNCGRSCTACPYIKQGKGIKINGIDWKINKQVNCFSYNVVYAICCKKDQCKEVYTGETKIMIKI